MNVALIGRSQFLYDTGLKLSKSGFLINKIITSNSSPEYTRKEADFEELAKKLKARFILSNSLEKKKLLSCLDKLDLGISFNWVTIISQEQIKCFRIGILNAHFGDLPRYRGNACPNWAIINGEKEIAVSVHLMESGKVLTYHNHSIEFERFGKRNGLEIIYSETNPEYLQGEIDTFWVQHSGASPVLWCKMLKNRLPLLHLKEYGIVNDQITMLQHILRVKTVVRRNSHMRHIS